MKGLKPGQVYSLDPNTNKVVVTSGYMYRQWLLSKSNSPRTRSSSKKPWSQEEIDVLKQLWLDRKTDKEIGEFLGRDAHSVLRQRKKQGFVNLRT